MAFDPQQLLALIQQLKQGGMHPGGPMGGPPAAPMGGPMGLPHPGMPPGVPSGPPDEKPGAPQVKRRVPKGKPAPPKDVK